MSRKKYYLCCTFYKTHTNTMNGKVKWFDSKKGYGFIIDEEGKEIFVHFTGIIKEGFKSLKEEQLVEFEIGNGDKGEQAINVKVIEK